MRILLCATAAVMLAVSGTFAAAEATPAGPRVFPASALDQLLGAIRRRGFRLVGAMTYEGQVAGVQDEVPTQRARSAVVRRIKSLSRTRLGVRRREA